jgi:hypothetical protein
MGRSHIPTQSNGGQLMEHFKVSPKIGINTESYWVAAASAESARRLIALNIPKAGDAESPAKFDCVANSHKQPPRVSSIAAISARSPSRSARAIFFEIEPAVRSRRMKSLYLFKE